MSQSPDDKPQSQPASTKEQPAIAHLAVSPSDAKAKDPSPPPSRAHPSNLSLGMGIYVCTSCKDTYSIITSPISQLLLACEMCGFLWDDWDSKWVTFSSQISRPSRMMEIGREECKDTAREFVLEELSLHLQIQALAEQISLLKTLRGKMRTDIFTILQETKTKTETETKTKTKTK
jgi:DNA-directed RNA polymerase subunit RPC12/RpoP